MQNMKKLPLIVFIGSLSACGGDGMPGIGGTQLANTVVASSHTLANGATAPADSNAYLVAAHQDGLAEIQLSQLAVQQAANDDVKKFAQRMIDHHTALNQAITELAQRKNVALPTTPPADLQSQLAALSAQSGMQFDLAYLQSNLALHEKDVAATRQQALQGSDADVRRLARTSLPVLQVHLAAAEDLVAGLDPASFLALAYRDGLAEVQLSQIAVQKVSDEDVRAFAQQMIDEHTQANARLAALAQQKGVALPDGPSAEQQAIAAELNALAGTDVDEAAMDANVINHVKNVRLFRNQANNGADADIKALAADLSDDIEDHLLSALEIDRSVEPSLPFRIFQDGEAEIAMSLVALDKTANADVRAFAQRMIDEHNAANTQLLQLAHQNNRILPTGLAPEHLLVIAELMQLSGEAFDRAYLELGMRMHDKDLQEAERELRQSTDNVIRTLAQAAVPILNDHLARARALRDQVAAQ